MAHYAYLDENGIVTSVIVGKNENDGGVDWEAYYGAKRTSYNTHGAVHSSNGVPFRKNYAGIGYTFDIQRDAFIPPKPYPSWILDEETCLWNPPIQYPNDGKLYTWEEETISWKEQINDPV
jgi:hypothetical protein